MRKLQLIGMTFSRLTVISESGRGNDGKVKWLCDCICGNQVSVPGTSLKDGTTRSCGCLAHDFTVNRNTSHGLSNRSEYTIWKGIKKRCFNAEEPKYPYYGGRGITVCIQWINDFPQFLKDAGPRPSMLHTLDRFPNNNGNYEPGNIRWATRKEQGGNKRNNRFIVHNGKSMILQDWADHLGMHVTSLHSRLKKKSFNEIYAKYNNR